MVEQVGVEHAGSVGDAHASVPAAQPACQWFSASVPAYGRYRSLLRAGHFVADLRPVFAAIWLTRSFDVVQRQLPASPAVAITGSCCTLCLFTGQTAKTTSSAGELAPRRFAPCRPTEEHSPTANRPLMRFHSSDRFRYRPWCSVRSDVPESVL